LGVAKSVKILVLLSDWVLKARVIKTSEFHLVLGTRHYRHASMSPAVVARRRWYLSEEYNGEAIWRWCTVTSR